VIRISAARSSAAGAQCHRALAVLLRLDRVAVGKHARRLGDCAEQVLDRPEGARLVEPAGDDQHGVVWLIVLFVERPKSRRRHALDIGARTDRRLPVVVPEVGGLGDPLVQDLRWIVLARLELVADDRELGLELLRRDRGVDHPIGLEIERPVEIVLGRWKRLEVVRTVVPGRTVRLRPALLEQLEHVVMARRAFEHHVLEQVRHARFAVAFESRADEVSDVDGDVGLRRVGEQQNLETVVEPVLGDALDASDLVRLRVRRGRHDVRGYRVAAREPGGRPCRCGRGNGWFRSAARGGQDDDERAQIHGDPRSHRHEPDALRPEGPRLAFVSPPSISNRCIPHGASSWWPNAFV
jgi:hypothetical protein